MMFRGVLAALLTAQSAADNLDGKYEGQVPFIIDVTATFDGSGAKADVDVNVKVASTRITCPGESIAEDDSKVTFPNAVNDGDCLGDGIRSDSKDPSKYIINKNSDGTLTYKSDGYPDLKMSKKSLMAEPEPVGGIPGEVFLEGFISGFIGEASHIKKCVTQSEQLVKDAVSLMSDLKAHKFNETVSDIEALVQDVGAELPACKGASKDLLPILEAFKGVHSIKDLMQKLKNNFLAHDRDILNILEDEIEVCTFGAPDAHKCGEDLGKQVRSVVVGDQSEALMVTNHGKIFMEGFIEGFIGKAEHIKACVGNLGKTEESLVKLISDIKSHKFNSTISDIQELVAEAAEDLSSCKDAGQDLAPLLTAFKDVHSIKDLMKKLKDNFLAHDKDMIAILEDMIEVCTFGAPDAHKCGEDLGRQVRSLVIGDQFAVLV